MTVPAAIRWDATNCSLEETLEAIIRRLFMDGHREVWADVSALVFQRYLDLFTHDRWADCHLVPGPNGTKGVRVVTPLLTLTLYPAATEQRGVFRDNSGNPLIEASFSL